MGTNGMFRTVVIFSARAGALDSASDDNGGR